MTEASDKICVLDDDDSVRSSIKHLLDSDGLTAQTFERGDDFLAHATGHKVALAILDVWLPDSSGLVIQGRLHEVSPDTRVIIMTGRERPGVRDAAMTAGAFAFLVKPFNDEIFIATVRRALRPEASYGPKVP